MMAALLWYAPNNSFKPTPCRGGGHVLCATLARVRRPATGRLNSGVRRHMTHPLSPRKELIEFCYRVETVDPLQIIDLACAEAYHHRQAHRQETGASDFRSGSVGRRYCEDLEKVVAMFVQGEIPRHASKEFIASVAPLVRRVTNSGWKVGKLAEQFADVA